MKRSDFEKRYGEINFDQGGGWNSDIADKYGITMDGDADLPAHIWHIMQNSQGVAILKYVQNVFKYLSGEPRKEVRDLFLKNLDSLYFASHWGIFSDEKFLNYKRLNTGVKILRCLKNGFKKYKYKPIYGKHIDDKIAELGGNVNTSVSFNQGSKKLQHATKLPRKLKKEVKKSGIWEMLIGRPIDYE